jgi:peptide alpha-N-acetyltransferase
VCKIDAKRDDDAAENNNDATDGSMKVYTGYIGMLAVEKEYRRSGIGTSLALRAIRRMQQMGCQSIQLETEVTNKGAMRLYEDRLGFIREELLVKYYLNWNNAYRLRLWLK